MASTGHRSAEPVGCVSSVPARGDAPRAVGSCARPADSEALSFVLVALLPGVPLRARDDRFAAAVRALLHRARKPAGSSGWLHREPDRNLGHSASPPVHLDTPGA